MYMYYVSKSNNETRLEKLGISGIDLIIAIYDIASNYFVINVNVSFFFKSSLMTLIIAITTACTYIWT